jgi:hypothetical protein
MTDGRDFTDKGRSIKGRGRVDLLGCNHYLAPTMKAIIWRLSLRTVRYDRIAHRVPFGETRSWACRSQPAWVGKDALNYPSTNATGVLIWVFRYGTLKWEQTCRPSFFPSPFKPSHPTMRENYAMARKVAVLDDLAQEENVETVTFTVTGRPYEIDLSPANQAKPVKAVGRFIRAGRDITSIPRNRHDPYQGILQTEVRNWAQANGLDVPGRRPRSHVRGGRKAQEAEPAKKDNGGRPSETGADGEPAT